MTHDSICAALGNHPWSKGLIVLDAVDSTNTYLKNLARQGAAHGTTVIAGSQTNGRGRRGRSFSSPAGKGLYLSVLWRVNADPAQLMHLTCMAAEAARRAIEKSCGIECQIKWINDLVAEGKKLCGILTELVTTPQGLAIVCGIGINCTQRMEDFPPEVAPMATSLAQLGAPASRSTLAAALMEQLALAFDALLTPQTWMASYRRHCLTLGQDVQLLQNDQLRLAHVNGMNDQGALLVTLADGTQETIFSGEASVRGMYGYL